jgi:hypothetical protein
MQDGATPHVSCFVNGVLTPSPTHTAVTRANSLSQWYTYTAVFETG